MLKNIETLRALSFENMENEETEIGFEFKGQWITNPFLDASGRFEFENIEEAYKYYGEENVEIFIEKLTKQN